ncbi:MAG: divergent PAP2 family protein [bacterium]|nr:divergent PAP2 family protein [Bacillota bacterium]HHW55190.1 divergent PAP2 family protein [Bacillota bacterium]
MGDGRVLENRVLVASLIAGIAAQILKVIINYLVKREIDFRLFVTSGGMPSSHTALVVALATGVCRQLGWNSTEFAIAVVFALIVMYDAAGVRRAVGKQAEILNIIMDEVVQKGRFREERLKELLGHTPKEVFAGGVLGLIVACFYVP